MSGGDKCYEKDQSRLKEIEYVVVCMHGIDVVALGKVIKGDLSKEVTFKPGFEWREGVSHGCSKGISFQE